MTTLGFILGCSAAGYGCYRLDLAGGQAFRRTALFRRIDGGIDAAAAALRRIFQKPVH